MSLKILLLVPAKENLRLERLMKRNNLELPEAKKRLNLQDEPIFPNFIIENNKDIPSLEKNVKSILAKINQ